MNEFDMVVDKLCEKFGVTAEYLLPRMIAYYKASAVAGVLVSFIVTLVCVFAIRTCFKRCEKEDVEILEMPVELFITIVCCAACIIETCVFFFYLMEGIKVFAAPEFYVIKQLIGMLK